MTVEIIKGDLLDAFDRGDWNIVLEMIEFYFKDHNVKIYQLESK